MERRDGAAVDTGWQYTELEGQGVSALQHSQPDIHFYRELYSYFPSEEKGRQVP